MLAELVIETNKLIAAHIFNKQQRQRTKPTTTGSDNEQTVSSIRRMTWTPFLAAMRNGIGYRANQLRTATVGNSMAAATSTSNTSSSSNSTPPPTTSQQTRTASAQASPTHKTPKHVPKETPKTMEQWEFIVFDVSS